MKAKEKLITAITLTTLLIAALLLNTYIEPKERLSDPDTHAEIRR